MNENWTSKNPSPELSDTDAELLSAYLDNMLDAGERAALEARLATEPFLRSELAAMRQMLGWLRTMPQLKAPRNFTLSEADVKPVAPKLIVMPRRNYWQLASAAAAVFVVLFGVLVFINQVGLSPKAEMSQVAAAPSEDARDEALTPLIASTSSNILMATAGIPPMASGGNDGQGQAEEQEAALLTGEVSETGGSADSDFGVDSEMNPVDASIESVMIEATSANASTVVAADGQALELSVATGSSQPRATTASTSSLIYGTATSQPTATAEPETVSEESMAASMQEDAAEVTAEMSIMAAPVTDEGDDYSSANLGTVSREINLSQRIKEILRGILQGILEDIQR
jgi:hypothetical protein